MNRIPRVSVIVIFRDARPFLDEAVTSVLAQDTPDWELLLCNDGSRDGSLNCARAWQARDERIHVLSHPADAWRGTGATRVLGLAAARGEFVSWLDADDVYRPSKLRDQQDLLLRHPEAALVYGPLELWSGDSTSLSFQPLRGIAERVHAPPRALLRLLGDERFIPGGSLIRRKAIEQVGGYDATFTRFYDDTLTTAKICGCWPVVESSSSWYRYRQHSASVTAQVTRVEGDRARRRFLVCLERDLRALGRCPEVVQRAIVAERRRARPGLRDWVRHLRRSFQR